VSLGRVIPVARHEAAADPLAEGGTEVLGVDGAAGLPLPGIGQDTEPAGGALSQALAAEAEPSLTMANAAAGTRTNELATQAGLVLRETGQQN